MEKQQYIDRAEQALYKVYNRFPVVFDRGEGYACMIRTERNIWILGQESL